MSSDGNLESTREQAIAVYQEKERDAAVSEITGMLGAETVLEYPELDGVEAAYELINEYGHNLEEDDNRANRELGWSLAQARSVREKEPSTEFEERVYRLLEDLDSKISSDGKVSGTVEVYAKMYGQGNEAKELTE